MFNYKKFIPTGNKAVDMVVACMSVNRERYLPIMAIHLRPGVYMQFDNYMRQVVPEDQQTGIYQFDGVDIVKGSWLQPVELRVEYYSEPIKAEA